MSKDKNPSPVTLSMGSTLPQIPAQFSYTNYKGEHEVRNVYPIGLWYGSTEWHPEKQWFIHAFDIDRNGRRDFALKDIGGRDEHAA
jgi:predicted DNA-binding transcriptional regulator YafY